jgi:GTP cyclohydrolase I
MVVEQEQAVHPGAQLDAFELPFRVPGPRDIDPERRTLLEWHASELLSSLGLDLDTPSTVDTPRRFVDAMLEATNGYEGDEKLLTAFPTECHGGTSCELAQIVEGPIPFHALCEHHAMPFFGRAWIGYVAHERIIGISKLTRLVRVVTRRFGVQERMTHQLATSVERLLDAHGVAVFLEADHLCTQMRGVRESGAKTRTTAWRGAYEHDPALRAEFLTLGSGSVPR